VRARHQRTHVELLDGHHVMARTGQDALERRHQRARDPEHLEEIATHDLLAGRVRGREVGIGRGDDLEARREDDTQARRRFEQHAEVGSR